MQGILHSDSSVLITGTTGLIGGEVLARLLLEDVKQIWALIRPTRLQSPTARLQERLAESNVPERVKYSFARLQPAPRLVSGGESEATSNRTLPNVIPIAPYLSTAKVWNPALPANLAALPGDITQTGWGLTGLDYQTVLDEVDIIIHNAADTSFAPIRRPEDTNISSVKWLIDLARRCRKAPLIVYMSTASNVGEVHNACLSEEDGCRPGNDHFNTYTHSKAVAEQMLRESGLPVLTLRPSIVLSAGLSNQRFASQILWCMPVTRLFKALPLDAHARIDLVDVGFVAQATTALLKKKNRQFDCYHLSAGPRHAITVSRLGRLLDNHYHRKPVLLIPPEEWGPEQERLYVRNRLQKRLFGSLNYYIPFMNMDVVFDDRKLRSELGPDCPAVRQIEEYLPALVDIISEKTALREAAVP